MLLDLLGRYAARMRTETLAPDLLHDAKRAMIDWFAAMLPGTRDRAAANLRAAVAEELGYGRAIVYGASKRAPARVAALLNGTASHITEFDDIFRDGIYHPGSPTIAAALATAQMQRASGLDLLRGVIVGYEISTRIAAAMVPVHYRFWHTTGTVGTFGAAAAAATILGAEPRPFAHAMATAATMAAGLQQGFRSDSMSKPLHAGHAAEAGVLAALAALSGFTGALDILEGEAGFGRAMGPDPDWNAAFADLGKVHNIARMTVKNHGCCGHTFAAIDGAKTLQAQHGVAPADIARIEIATYGTALRVAGLRSVETPFEGKFSLPYVVATALVYGNARADAFTPERLRDSATQALMQRISLTVDPELDARFPKQRAARVTIEMRDGRRFTHLQQTRKGDPDDPLSDSELDEKFIELAGAVLGPAEAQHALVELHQLDTRQDCDLLAPKDEPARHVA